MTTVPHELHRRIERLDPQQRALLARRLGLDHREATGSGSARLVAYIVPRDPTGMAPDPLEVRAFLKERLPEHMIPHAFVVLERLPRTPNGKLDVRELPETEPAENASGASEDGFVAPRNPVEETLARIWADLFGGAKVGVYDNFFEIGGDSILSIQVVARANRAGLRLTADQLFQHQTIAELAQTVATTPGAMADQGVVTGAVPLTPIQHWFFEQPLPELHHWHHHVWLEATERIDADLLGETVRHVMLHHDALRLRVSRHEGAWRQEHAPDAPIRVRRLDVSGLPVKEQERALTEAAYTLSRETDLGRGPLVGVLLAKRGNGRSDRVLISVHHLVIDAVSWQPLLEDLSAAYSQLVRGQEVSLPRKSASFRSWSEALAEYARSPGLRSEADFWLALPTEAARIRTDRKGAFTESSARTVVAALGPEETELLLRRGPGASHLQLEEVLLTALARVLLAWTGDTRLRIGFERHGRESIAEGLDVSRTVGWFTAYFPVVLELPAASGCADALQVVPEQLRRIPSRGIGYGVLRYLSPDAAVRAQLRAAPEPEVIFNYAGRAPSAVPVGAVLRPLTPPSASRSPRNRRSHLLEINAHHVADRLQFDWTYSAELHHRKTIERLATGCLEALRELIRHWASGYAGRYTPADFPEAGLEQEELDQLLGRLFS